jgi:Protein of unknown function (DUF1475)
MNARVFLISLFAFIFVTLLACTSFASSQQAVWEWQGLTREPDRWWTIATLLDAYYGFVTFYVWVWFKEKHFAARAIWFVLIMALGNMAMSAYVLIALFKLKANEPVLNILLPTPLRRE